jgi:hypothetical protein
MTRKYEVAVVFEVEARTETEAEEMVSDATGLIAFMPWYFTRTVLAETPQPPAPPPGGLREPE